MLLSSYKELIRNLPYLEQSFETKKGTWMRDKYAFSAHLNKFLSEYFIEDTLRISRWDLFEFTRRNPFDAVIAIIMWGYPSGMRGDSFISFLQHIEKIKYKLIPEREISTGDFTKLLNLLPGIGLSTMSKFLYFFSNKLEGVNCLIFDRRVIATLNAGTFDELNGLKNIQASAYVTYLQNIQEQAKLLECKPDQLELFLYMFGGKLKASPNFEYYTKVQRSLLMLSKFETELQAAILSLLAGASPIIKSDAGKQITESSIKNSDDNNAKKMYNVLLSVTKAKNQLLQTWY